MTKYQRKIIHTEENLKQHKITKNHSFEENNNDHRKRQGKVSN